MALLDDVIALADTHGGAVYDFGDLASLFTDPNGTVPATNDDDPIRYAADLSNNGCNSRQPLTGNRPRYSASEGGLTFSNSWLLLDQSNFFAADLFASLNVKGGPQTDRRLFAESNNGGDPLACYIQTGNSSPFSDLTIFFRGGISGSQIQQGSSGKISGFFDNSGFKVASFHDDGSNFRLRADGVAGSDIPYSNSGTRVATDTALGCLYRGGSALATFTGSIKRVVIIRASLSVAERQLVEDWVSGLDASNNIAGTVDATLASLTSISSATSSIDGAGNTSLQALQGSSFSDLRVAGSTSQTFAPLAANSAASLSVAASANTTMQPLQGSSSGSRSVTAAAAGTLAPLTAPSLGNLRVSASSATELQPIAGSATGTSGSWGHGEVIFTPLTSQSSGMLQDVVDGISGSANATFAGLATYSSAELGNKAIASVTLNPIIGLSSAALHIGGAVSGWFSPLAATSHGTDGGDLPETIVRVCISYSTNRAAIEAGSNRTASSTAVTRSA